jgi:5-(carboxyamino)imidazole ribonucleotide synthase
VIDRVLPGGTIGVLGSGQLGRMLALAARRMGYRVHTYSPDTDSPTGQVADVEVTGAYEDLPAIRRFASAVDVVTMEFENVSAEAAGVAADVARVRPSGSALHTTQQRAREKAFLQAHGFPVAPCVRVTSADGLRAALGAVGTPAIVKTAAFGYDGKGQQRVQHEGDVAAVWSRLGGGEAIVEQVIDFACEVSVVAARGADGTMVDYGAVENVHRHHILHLTMAPARVAASVAAEASALTRRVMEALDYVGVLCVEFFVTRDGRLLVNEIAPRPHNSGHYTIEACATSQFEQQVRAVCGLPLGSTVQRRPAAMINLLGDVWAGGAPQWAEALAVPGVALHLYGKAEPRAGRKMGHLTAQADTLDDAVARVTQAYDALQRR